MDGEVRNAKRIKKYFKKFGCEEQERLAGDKRCRQRIFF